jgi:phosphoribosyl 1,2-cyclic phosphate phosphodiesterase
MKIHFLGSGASEGIPNPFCRCDICQQARKVKGKEVRTHSSAIIDDVLLIDLAPTFSHQILRDGLDGSAITDLLFTHTHPDHFNAGELFSRMEGFGHGLDHPLNIYGNDMAITGCLNILNGYSEQRFCFHRLVPFVTVRCGKYQVTPLLANHARWEQCYLYYIEKDDCALFYGHDSGWFPESTWRWLLGKRIDIAVLECTYGDRQGNRTDNHMSLSTVCAAVEKLRNQNSLGEQSQVVLSHISHSSAQCHETLVAWCQARNMIAAWDGLIVNSQG